MLVRYFLFRTGYRLGWIVRYIGNEAEIAPIDGSTYIYLCHGAVEGYARLWEGM